MALVRNIALMAGSTALRLGFGLLTFIVMARQLGPGEFGIFMLWLSIATLATLVANFGFTPHLLREIGARPASAQVAMSEVLTAKLLLSTFVLVCGAVSIYWIEAQAQIVFMVLLIALLADSMTEFFNVGFRATNRFGDETRLASIASTLQFGVVIAATSWDPRVEMAATAFMLSRVIVLGMTWISHARYCSELRFASVRSGIERIRIALAFAADFGLQSLFGQIDSIVLNHYAGPAAVGIYQAGMRLFNGGAQAAGVLANVFLPRAAMVADEPKKFRTESARIQWAFIIVGLSFGLLLAGGADAIVRYVFGPAFQDLSKVLPWFGALFFIRFFAASWGVVLTSAGEQSFRAATNFLQWIVVLVVATIVVPYWGSIGWLASLLLGNVLISAAYCMKGMQVAGGRWQQLTFTLASALVFIPLLHWPTFGSAG